MRNLASRSAEAAKEIKNMVENASSKATKGKEVANKMINGYVGVTDNINKTIELISDVEVATKEQLQGIKQINNVVASLDHKTQQNASIASQTHGIALETDAIAKLIVADTNEKNFIGKDSVKARIHDIASKKEIVVVKSKNILPNKSDKKQVKKVETKSTIISSNISDDNKWDSF